MMGVPCASGYVIVIIGQRSLRGSLRLQEAEWLFVKKVKTDYA